MGLVTSPVTGRRLRSSVVILAAIATLHLSGRALALSPDLTIKQLHHTAWGPSQGMPLGGAVALEQTNDGYLWIAGLSALFRFDGIAFERVELPHDPKLSSLTLFSAFAPRGGGLWVGFLFGGVAFLKAGHWQVFNVADGVPPGTAFGFAETPDGTLWVATSSDLARFDGARWKAVGSEMGLPVGENTMVFVDSQGTIWADGGERLFFLRPGEHQFRNQPVAAPTPWPARNMAESSTGTVWLDAGNDLVAVAQNPPPAKPGKSSSYGPAFDHDGALWDLWHGLRRVALPEHPTAGAILHLKDIADAYTEADGLTAPAARALCFDSEGNVWVGTPHGLERFSEPRFKAPLQAAENQKVFPITEPGVAPADDAGGLWITNGVDALVRYQNGRIRPPILRQEVDSLLRVADGTVWFGGLGALWRERQGHLESVAPPGPHRETHALAQEKSGALWASVLGSGVFRLKDGVWTPYGGIAALPRGPALTIVRDRHDRLWFSYLGGSVAVLDGEQVRAYGVADGLHIGNVLANHPGRIGHWFGGEFGLARFEGKRFDIVQSAPELPLDGITGIVETSDGDLWLNGGSGIVHLASTELERSRLDTAYRVHGETLGAFDGVVGTGSMGPFPTAIEAGDGMLWFATTGGIYGIDPARRVHNRVPPPVLIRALTVSGHTIKPTPRLTLPAYTTAVSFDYVALCLTTPEKVRYRYRLDSIDSDWRPLTASRQALYTNLRPGKYTFHVTAANNDGVWNEQGDSLAFSIPPAFIQTGWFLALCVAAGALAISALVRLRVRQVAARVRARMEAQLAERERIARELHDTLLQSFQGSLLRFQTVADLLPTRPTEAKRIVVSAVEQAAQAIAEGRNAVQGLRVSAAETTDLAVELRMLGELAAAETNNQSVGVTVEVEGTPRALMPIVRDEIYRIAAEALRNALRHSAATQIELELRYDAHQLRLRIRDNGKGIESEALRRATAGEIAGHHGLHGMGERASLIGGKLNVWTSADSGTEVELTVRASRVYARSASRGRSWLARWFARKTA